MHWIVVLWMWRPDPSNRATSGLLPLNQSTPPRYKRLQADTEFAGKTAWQARHVHLIDPLRDCFFHQFNGAKEHRIYLEHTNSNNATYCNNCYTIRPDARTARYLGQEDSLNKQPSVQPLTIRSASRSPRSPNLQTGGLMIINLRSETKHVLRPVCYSMNNHSLHFSALGFAHGPAISILPQGLSMSMVQNATNSEGRYGAATTVTAAPRGDKENRETGGASQWSTGRYRMGLGWYSYEYGICLTSTPLTGNSPPTLPYSTIPYCFP